MATKIATKHAYVVTSIVMKQCGAILVSFDAILFNLGHDARTKQIENVRPCSSFHSTY